jgi:stage II sporulation protein AA (anti-sigma F factor antagonist)
LPLDPSPYGETPFEARFRERDGAATVELAGVFDLSSKPTFERLMGDRLSERVRKLTLDLRAVTFIDSSALGLILELWDQSRRDGFDFAICSPSGQVARVFEVVGLDRALATTDEAPSAKTNGAKTSSLPQGRET